MRDLTSGAQLASRYTLVRKLGSGQGAETWLANDRATNASIALKIRTAEDLPPASLKREWQLSIRLMHAHIVRVFEYHDSSEDDAIAFYAMQFIDGDDIGTLTGTAPGEILAPIALLADALRYAHDKGVVHRDIKTANIILDRGGAPYLIDFGVAAADGGHIGGGSLIAASPQQLDGQAPAPADDIFALGGLIYELISGQSPYSSTNTEDDIRHRVPPSLRARNGEALDPALEDLVARMLDKDATARPDAESVLATLKSAGINPGPAVVSGAARAHAVQDEVIDSDNRLRRRDGDVKQLPESAHGGGAGISARTVVIGFSALVLLLIVVIFVLPKAVTDGPTDEATATIEVEDDVGQTDAVEEAESDDAPRRDERVQARQQTEATLGRLLAKVRTLEGRAVQRWGGLAWKRVSDAYSAGDEAYLARDYALADEKYAEAIEAVDPLLERVDAVFQQTLTEAETALENAETSDALRLYELAVAISPSHGPARAGLARAKSLDAVLSLMERGLTLERDLEMDAALENFDQAIELDPQWQPAVVARERVLATMNQMAFDQRMTEGLTALAENDFLGARAAFRVAQQLQPGSPEPGDGLLQIDQGVRLQNISALEREATGMESAERWQAAADSYTAILELDGNLTFAQQGLRRSNQMVALHEQLEGYIQEPDTLSVPRTMQTATELVVGITRMPEIGARLGEQRDQLTLLLKRAATPLTVQLVSDDLTEVSIYKVGKLGTFGSTELSLRPGTYVAVGSRPGFRDVRLEFRVAPEIDMQPVVVRCEEGI